jgi:hypothetical protein
MIWLLRFWKPFAMTLVVGLILVGSYRWAYSNGVEATREHYEPILAAAELAKARAEERTRTLETTSQALVAEQEARHVEALKAIDDRAADYQRRYAGLLRQYNARRSGSEVPAVPGSTAGSVEPSGSDERIERSSAILGDTGRRCERDAERLAGWIAWYREQSLLLQQ